MKTFKTNLITTAIVASGITLGSLPVMAQQNDTSQNEVDEQNVEVIEVSGIRASLQKSQAIKMSETSIVEAITAEDIGKLPDSSIAESIARLPGLAAQRLNGRSSSIAIRGLGEDFSTATFNGREQVTLGDNRGVEFDVYPSEIMNEVIVYKTPEATLMTQGIGGTIDMRTIKPLAHGEQTMAVSLRGEKNDIGALNPDGEDTGWRGSFSYIDQFANDTVGVALSYAHMDSPNNEERFNTWGWPDGVIGGMKPFVRSAELTRDTLMAVVEYSPSPDLRVNADALYIDFEDDQKLRGIEIPAAWGDAGLLVGETLNGQSLTGTIGLSIDPETGKLVRKPVGGVVRNDVTVREAELYAFGLNLEYDLNENWVLEFDAAYSQVERKTWALEAYAGSGRGPNDRQPEQIGFSFSPDFQSVNLNPMLDYGDHSVIQLGNPQCWGGGNLTDPDSCEDQDGFINTPTIDDELTTFKLAAQRMLNNDFISSIEFGAYFSDRTKEKQDNGFFLTLPGALDSESDIIPGYQEAVPEEYRLPNTSLAFIGIDDMISFDSLRFWRDGNYVEYDSRLTDAARWENTWEVNEEVTIGFVKANIDTLLGDVPVRGNVGVQAVYTDQSSDGFSLTSNGVQNTNGGTDYTEFLPSLNLIFDITEDQAIRFGVSKTMSRSRMDRMNASTGNLGYNEVSKIWEGSVANPELKPVTANQLDLTYENYFHAEGYFAAAVFYKDISDWQERIPTFVSTSDLTPPAGQPAAPIGVLSSWQNVGDGKVTGAEFTISLPGTMFSDMLEGFGGIFSATYLDSELEYEVEVPTDLNGGTEVRQFKNNVPGLSDEVYNATVYYERAGFQTRVSLRKRTDFLGEVAGLSLNREPVNVVGSTLVDAQISYDFSESGIESLKGLTVTLQGQNLTDEEFVTAHSVDGGGYDIRDVQRFGRNFLFGINYTF